MKNLKIKTGKLLLIGIGNCGRKDDGLGWKFTDYVSSLNIQTVDCEFRYQLQVEDALLVSQYDKVIFVDASHVELSNGFDWTSCKPASHYYFSSHIQTPETILYMAKELYHSSPEAYILAITGDDWGLGSSLSQKADENLKKAMSFFDHKFSTAVQETS